MSNLSSILFSWHLLDVWWNCYTPSQLSSYSTDCHAFKWSTLTIHCQEGKDQFYWQMQYFPWNVHTALLRLGKINFIDKVFPLWYIHMAFFLFYWLHKYVFAFMRFVYPYFSGLLHWHWGNLMIAPVPVKQPWRIWIKLINTKLQFKKMFEWCTHLMGWTALCCVLEQLHQLFLCLISPNTLCYIICRCCYTST